MGRAANRKWAERSRRYLAFLAKGSVSDGLRAGRLRGLFGLRPKFWRAVNRHA